MPVPQPTWTGSNVSIVDKKDGSIDVSWNSPTETPDSYSIVYNGSFVDNVSSPATVIGFTNGQSVTITVVAHYVTNYLGDATSDISSTIVIAISPPIWTGSNVSVVDKLDGSIDVSWNSPVVIPDSYSIIFTGGSVPNAVSPTTIFGFTNGDPVTFSVVAHYTTNYSGDATSDVNASVVIHIPEIGGRVGGGGGASGHVAVPCFLASAPVLTPTGYTRISKLVAGDEVMTADGRAVRIQQVLKKKVATGPSTNPYIIPAGKYGATRNLAISPNHRVVMPDGSMVEARHLGLKQQERDEGDTIEYYNLELPCWTTDNMVIAGVAVESLAPIRRMTMTLEEFKNALVAQYGDLTPSILENIQKTGRFNPEMLAKIRKSERSA